MDGIYWTRGARNRVWTRYRTLLAASPVPLQEVRFPTRFGETCVFTCGPRQGPPLVLIHGGNANSAMWLHSLPAWSKRFRIYAVDSIGDPGFSAATRPPLHTDDHALWLDDVFRSLNLTSVCMAGASFGAWIALDFAIRRPHAVSSLVLVAPAGLTRIPAGVSLGMTALMFLGARGRRRALMRGFGLSEANLTDDQRSFLAFCGVVQRNALSRIRIPAPIPDERLRQLSVRTLAILGGKDLFFDSGVVSRRLREHCRTVTVRVIAQAGHASFDSTDLTEEFLAGGSGG